MKEFNSVEEVIEAVRGGKIVVVMDDEDRENEGDVICAAEFATPENVNFMASYAKGLICMPMHVDYVEKLGLDMMCSVNTDNHGTAFTEFVNSNVKILGNNAFDNCELLTSVKCINCNSVGDECFIDCQKLKTINLSTSNSKSENSTKLTKI